ncbi:MAG: tryptophan--tRNA ligase [Candidatus Omnitrophica bacterium]|nr:tryptophan--tRNA ligase [Candidatus Omnitrophota bacterium]MBU1128163.1 tryptophan--tRNA ligase [Candidatus Omnitrophota bacterium]MBU1656952.1 tryptophan--tRNA ligase [Candidatus Omnitrophota bacterium]MBU1785085.1 tryptophan--tRNA ligase [Candidatus Omnitrophota bacterium]MBU1851478.1 tryptophan--tRNA ligase [Candidatus Omnitrophota bacterium]
MKKSVLSGMRPTGRLHLGHLLGALENWVELQEKYDCFFMVADWHALMSEYEKPSDIRQNSLEIVKDWIACGIDPDKSVVFVQSMVSEHLELAMVFSILTPLGWLERCTTYKEQMREIKGRMLATYGFLGYPVLQAADIALYGAHYVPVGVDQLPHLELAREIIRKFHKLYKKNIFEEPDPMLTKVSKLVGLDNRKMSKSYGNFIALSDSPYDVKRKVYSMYTDPKRVSADVPGTVDGNPVFIYHDLFNPNKKEVESLKERYRTGKVGDVEVKKKLTTALNDFLDPIRQKRDGLTDEYIHGVLVKGADKACAIAKETMSKVKECLHQIYR